MERECLIPVYICQRWKKDEARLLVGTQHCEKRQQTQAAISKILMSCLEVCTEQKHSSSTTACLYSDRVNHCNCY